MNEEGRPPGGQPQEQHYTASECSREGGGHIALLPLGERGWYPCRACAYCGAIKDLRPAIAITFAETMICEDTVACERRRYWKRAA